MDERARAAPLKWQPPAVIFTTVWQHAVDAFEVHAIDYLLKPVRTPGCFPRYPEGEALRVSTGTRRANAVRAGICRCRASRVILVPVDDIVYFRPSFKYRRSAPSSASLQESRRSSKKEFGDASVHHPGNLSSARTLIEG